MASVVLSGESYWAKPGWKVDNYAGEINEVKIKVTEEYKDKVIATEPMLRNAFKFDDSGKNVGGGWYGRFRVKKLKWNGDEDRLPVYTDINGEEWDPAVMIGNGSTVKVGIEVYQAKKAPSPSVILREVRVVELAEYDPDKETEFDMDDELV